MLVSGRLEPRFAHPPLGRRVGRWSTIVVLAAVAIVAVVPVSLAMLTDNASNDGSFTAATLAPPTGVSATGGTSVTLGWTASTSTAATGYQVERATALAGPYSQIGTATPISATSYPDGPPAGTYWYRLSTYIGSWTSTTTVPVSATVTSTSTGETPCLATSTIADTGGDGNGYQTNPGNACASDGALAIDAATGIAGRSTSCANPANDRHRFWGYAFALPGTVTAITGITVRADAGLNNNGGSSVLCVELSWDGGTTWTASQSVALSGAAVATYTLGSATDTWGRTWALGEFATTAFVVRVTDATNHPTKDYRLDFLAVTVDYAP